MFNWSMYLAFVVDPKLDICDFQARNTGNDAFVLPRSLLRQRGGLQAAHRVHHHLYPQQQQTRCLLVLLQRRQRMQRLWWQLLEALEILPLLEQEYLQQQPRPFPCC